MLLSFSSTEMTELRNYCWWTVISYKKLILSLLFSKYWLLLRKQEMDLYRDEAHKEMDKTESGTGDKL